MTTKPKKQTPKPIALFEPPDEPVGDFLIDAVKNWIAVDLGPKVDVSTDYSSGMLTLWLSELPPLETLTYYAQAFLWLPHVLAAEVKHMGQTGDIAVGFRFELNDREAVLNMYN